MVFVLFDKKNNNINVINLGERIRRRIAVLLILCHNILMPLLLYSFENGLGILAF